VFSGSGLTRIKARTDGLARLASPVLQPADIMRNALPPSHHSSTPESTPGLDAVLASARLLQRAEEGPDSSGLPLRGKNLGLICASQEDADALLFRSAAAALGASVSHIPANPGPAGSALLGTARVLGRLYDGIECQGLTPALVRQLGRDAGVPVFDGLATADHPTARLAPRLAGAGSPEKKRELILKAVLLFALS
jgi:ornithine carbamoyltransferase